ncbi:hypothetical protein EXN66_Car016887 [Channa argus]|uniref:Uncharacterized protein n=1 Tax=Channa argus TaxID=215402 RepID=A0A6G1QFN1_CHAAH|nr:hypothetical protein EXN66_Car016887 [Channa argus]
MFINLLAWWPSGRALGWDAEGYVFKFRPPGTKGDPGAGPGPKVHTQLKFLFAIFLSDT